MSTSDRGESVIRLEQDTKRRLSKFSGTVKTITEFLSDAVEKGKDVAFPEAIKQAAPWAEPALGAAAEAAGEVLPPVKFLLKLAEKITEINDPEELGHLACTVAFERAAEQAIKEVGGPVEEKRAIRDVKEQLSLLEPTEEVDLGAFTYENALDHEFFKRAEGHLQAALIMVGYGGPQVDRISNEVKDRFVVCLRTLLSHRDTAEKFAPFREYIELGGARERQAYKALAEHASYQRWLFEEAPVLGKSPFALRHVYVETDCGKLTWGQINPPEQHHGARRDAERQNSGEKQLDPFSEQDGGRQSLVKTVLELIGNAKLREPIVIQGIAGAGKSSFTLRLCVELLRHQLRPIRIRLKDLRFDRHVSEALPQAVKLSDEQRSPDGIPTTPEDLFRGGSIFREPGSGAYSKICRYVLILDGWDEISVANEGFRRRLERMLEQIRHEYIDNATLSLPIHIILTGRPSPDLTQSGFLRDKTPILTIRPLTPEQLRSFIQNLSSTVKAHPLQLEEEDAWPDFDPDKFAPVIERYEEEFARLQDEESRSSRSEMMQTGSLGALGLPLLAQLAARLISVWPEDPEQLVDNSTTLYRNLVNLTCEKGGKAEIDAEATDEIRGQSRIVGYELRDLLWQTAGAMTTYGKDLIPYEELSKRLNLEEEELDERVGKATSRHSLSALLISFYFKGGVKHLGCEFVHKSFREYLFAEAIVETLKRYGETAPEFLPEREKYWKDFSESDARHRFSRDLAQLLAPQWLSDEVMFHLDNLIEWEISKALGARSSEAGTTTKTLGLDGWRRVRDGLADLWDWWGEGVHLRPQPSRGNRRELKYDPPYVTDLIEFSMPFESALTEAQPPRTTTMDAHLGAGLFGLCTPVHYYLATMKPAQAADSQPQAVKERSTVLRKYQSQADDGTVRFAPSKPNEGYFLNYIHRINSAGWRPGIEFPSYADLRGVDLTAATLYLTIFDKVNLTDAILNDANLYGAYFGWANLHKAQCIKARLDASQFHDATLREANLSGADLSNVDLTSIDLTKANLSGADLENVNFNEANLTNATLDGATLRGSNLLGAIGLTKEQLARANTLGAQLPSFGKEGSNIR